MFSRKLISRKACSPTRSENASRPLVLVYRQRCVRLYVIFIALEIMESVLTFHDDNFSKFHVMYACTRKKKENRNFNPGLTAWIKRLDKISQEESGVAPPTRYNFLLIKGLYILIFFYNQLHTFQVFKLITFLSLSRLFTLKL